MKIAAVTAEEAKPKRTQEHGTEEKHLITIEIVFLKEIAFHSNSFIKQR